MKVVVFLCLIAYSLAVPVPGSDSDEQQISTNSHTIQQLMELYRMYNQLQQQGVSVPAPPAPLKGYLFKNSPTVPINEDASEEEAQHQFNGFHPAQAAAPLNSDEAEAAEEAEEAEGTEAPEAAEGTEAPEAAEGTEATQAAEGTEAPEAAEGTEVTQAAEGTEAAEVTEGTEVAGPTADPQATATAVLATDAPVEAEFTAEYPQPTYVSGNDVDVAELQ